MEEKREGLDAIIQDAVENLRRRNEVELVSLRHGYDSEFEDLKKSFRRQVVWFFVFSTIIMLVLWLFVFIRAQKYGRLIDEEIAESTRWTERNLRLQEEVRGEIGALKNQEAALRKILEEGPEGRAAEGGESSKGAGDNGKASAGKGKKPPPAAAPEDDEAP